MSNMSNASSSIPPEWVALLSAYQSGQESVRAEMREHYVTKADLGNVREDLRGEIGQLREETTKEFAAVRREIGALRESTTTEFAAVRGEISKVREDVLKSISHQTWTLVGLVLALVGVLVIIPRLLP